MTSALTKVDTPLSERYTTTCTNCGYIRQIFGTEKEARESAEKMGWEFRVRPGVNTTSAIETRWPKEVAYCPHCKHLVKP